MKRIQLLVWSSIHSLVRWDFVMAENVSQPQFVEEAQARMNDLMERLVVSVEKMLDAMNH